MEDYGWQGILHLDRSPRGLCLPKDLGRFLEVCNNNVAFDDLIDTSMKTSTPVWQPK